MKILGLKVIDAKPIIKKNLEENHLYKFVDFNENDLEYKEKYTDLFKLSDSSLNINISCIVGRNGTGKTSILEIIYRIINNISFDQFHKETDLSYAYGFYAQLFVEINTKIAVFEINNRNDFLYFNETPNTKYDIVNEKLTDEIILDFSYTIVNNYSYYSFNLDDYYDDEEKVDGSWLEQLFNKNDGYLTPLVINPKRDYWGTIDCVKFSSQFRS